MRAVGVMPGKREVRIIEHAAPGICAPNDVKVRSLEVGICGTDREICSFVYGSPPDGFEYLVLGHESLGQVVEVGAAVSRFKAGDLPEGAEKSIGFIDDPSNADFAALLNAADKRETVQFYVELPNGRTSTSILSLSGWKMNEITAPASEVIQITVQGKQNSNTWGTVTPKV